MVILTQLPLKFMFRTANYTGRISIWNTILGAFDIKYIPRTSIKGQILADLVAEFVEPLVEVATRETSMDGKLVEAVSMPGPPCWKVYIDGAANQRESTMGLVLKKSLRFRFLATNN